MTSGLMPQDWNAYSLRPLKDVLASSIRELGEEAVLGAIGHAITSAALFHRVEMRFNNELQLIQVRRPVYRSKTLVNPIENLTPHEKERLGFIFSWALNGPEQGFCTNQQAEEFKKELVDFLNKNHIETFTEHEAKDGLAPKA